MFIYPADRVRLDEGVAIADSYLERGMLGIFLGRCIILGRGCVEFIFKKRKGRSLMLQLSELKMELDGARDAE